MKAMRLVLLLVGFQVWCCSLSYGATISGNVKGPDGVALKGAWVSAQNSKTRISVTVLSDKDGRYHLENLPAGEYQVQAKAIGYKSDARSGVTLTATQATSFDFPLQKGMVRWADLSLYQGLQLLPTATGKQELTQHCFNCHGFESRMASVVRDEDGWRDRVNYMRETEHYFLTPGVTDEIAAKIVSYLNAEFGEDSTLPKSPAELPGYQGLVPSYSDDASKIVYVEYELPGPNRMPWNADPDKNGIVWLPYYGHGNKIGRLDPKTAQVQEFPVPNQTTAGIHSVTPAPDGSVWLSEQGANKLGKWDPKTQTITEFQDAYLPGKELTTAGGQRHTVRVDGNGFVWATGNPLTRFDPKTEKFADFRDEVGASYGITNDKQGNVWFTAQGRSAIGMGDKNTGRVTLWTVPTDKSFPRRIMVDPAGAVWFTEYTAGKLGRFDPETKTFKEFVLPGPRPTPYAIGIDKTGGIWYSSQEMDQVGHMDPNSGQVTLYPFDHAEITMREFNADPDGRMWYTSPANNKVGYFYLAGGTQLASRLP